MPLLLPFFKFDVQAWLTSETVMLMMNDQRGGFITLLAKCWAHLSCSLPNDRERVKALADWRGNDEEFERVWGCFIPDRKQPDRLINRRLMKEWKEAKLKQAFYAERAKAGAEARWADKPVRTRARRSEKPPPENWLDKLKANSIYAHVNWTRELGKIEEWRSRPENKHRVVNQRFVANWVNKIEPPLLNGSASLTCPYHPQLTFTDPHAKKAHDFDYHTKPES